MAFTVLGYIAPLGGAAGYLPLVIGYGNGLGAPLIFVLCGVVLLLFSLGYMAMVRQVPRPGAFYAYISAGLGRRVGLGAGALTLAMYVIGAVGFHVFGGLAARAALSQEFGVDLPWWACTAALMAIIGVCSYRGIDFNSRVLAFVVVVEVSLIALFDAVTMFRGGPTGHPSEPFTWNAFTSGSVAVAALFAIALYSGFESTAIFREEARDPGRTIPRATYVVTVIISLFYCATTYCVITALGTRKAVTAADDPAGSFATAFGDVLGHSFSQLAAVMIVTSVVASELAMANVTTRYFYSFSIDRVLPRALGAVHRRHGSPYRAALMTSTVTAAGVLTVTVTGLDPQMTYGIFGGVGVYAFETLMLLVSCAVLIYFRRDRGTGESPWVTILAPGISVLSFGFLLCFSAMRSDLLLGKPTPLTVILFAAHGGAFAIGFGMACWMALRNPAGYARIGRSEPHEVDARAAGRNGQ